MKKNTLIQRTLKALTLLVGSAIPSFAQVPVAITVNSDPSVSGSGANLKATFSNVATVDGVAVDLFAEILSQSSTKTNTFFRSSDDFVFGFKDGQPGEDRTATVKWSFFKKGTTTPIMLPVMQISVDDLDNFSARLESLFADKALGFVTNNPTNVSAGMEGGTLYAEGGSNQNPGDPRGAVKLFYAGFTSFTISYHTIFRQASVSYYHHDGDEDFDFTTPTPPPALPIPGTGGDGLLFHYSVKNDEPDAMHMDLFDRLPVGLKWDTSYTPVIKGDIKDLKIDYSDDQLGFSITKMLVGRGSSSIKLKTVSRPSRGLISNDSMITLNGAIIDPITANSSIDLGDLPSLIKDLCGSEIFDFAAIATEKQLLIDGMESAFLGDVAVCEAAKYELKKGAITGSFIVHPPGNGKIESVDNQPGAGGSSVSPIFGSLTKLRLAASSVSTRLAALKPTQTFGTILNDVTINAADPDGVNIIQIKAISLSSSKVLTLKGGGDDFFILNIKEKVELKNFSTIKLTGGLTPQNVLIHMLPGSSDVILSSESVSYPGTILSIYDKKVELKKGGLLFGAIVGSTVSVMENAQIVHTRFGCEGSGGSASGGGKAPSWGSGLAPVTVVLEPQANTVIRMSAPTEIGDTAAELLVASDSIMADQALLYFDVSSIPVGATIYDADLYLTNTQPVGPGGVSEGAMHTPGPYSLHSVMSGFAWREGGLTWDSAIDGLQNDDIELASSLVDQSLETQSIPGIIGLANRKVWNVAPILKAWVNSPASNNGFGIIAPALNKEIFYSKETVDPNVRPKLVITYTP